MATRNARIGLVLFALYLLLYGGFVLLNAYSPETMEWTPLAGINLAILYGFGLIVAALVLALVYGWLCRANDDGDGTGDGATSNGGGNVANGNVANGNVANGNVANGNGGQS